MLRWSMILFVLAITSAIFGFTFAWIIAKVLFFIFLALFVISILFGAEIFRK